MATTTETTTNVSQASSREVSPNRGFTVQDLSEAQETHLSQDEFRKQYGIDPSRQAKLVKLSFLRYQHPDLQVIKAFLKDFGFFKVKETATEIWFRGYGADQFVYYARKGPKQFLGGAFEADSYNDLQKTLDIPGVKVLSNGIEKMEDAPGGGFIVTVEDPHGFPISLVYGQAPAPPREMPSKLPFNDEVDKPRIREWSRFKAGPAAIHKAGHYGFLVKDFPTQFKFYTQNFNIIPTNILYVEQDNKKINVGMFAHVDRGDDLVDHHTLFCVSLPPGHENSHVHHSSYEIHDFDTQAMGHDWLTRKGYEPVWGLGRHLLGSQIFDYWWDPHGFMVEHYIDGDVVNKDTPVSFHYASSAREAAWGPDIPASFLE